MQLHCFELLAQGLRRSTRVDSGQTHPMTDYLHLWSLLPKSV